MEERWLAGQPFASAYRAEVDEDSTDEVRAQRNARWWLGRRGDSARTIAITPTALMPLTQMADKVIAEPEDETVASGASGTCRDCGKEIELKVCKSAAGCYIGTWCCIGPVSRELDCFETAADAERALGE